MEPVINLPSDKPADNISENAAVPGPSGYVPPSKKNDNAPALPEGSNSSADVNNGSKSANGKGVKNKSSGKASKTPVKRPHSQDDDDNDDFQAPLSMYDPVSFPGYLFQPIPSILKIDELHKRLIIVQIEATRTQALFYDQMQQYNWALERLLVCSECKE